MRRPIGQRSFESLERRVCLSTVGFVERDVASGDLLGTTSIEFGDLDGDADLDMLVFSGSKILWYPKLDDATYGEPRTVSQHFPVGVSAVIADLDGDGDHDIAASSYFGNKVSWFENVDGQGRFSGERLAGSEHQGAATLLVSDVDADGDQDLVSLAFFDGRLFWLENSQGNGSQWRDHTIAENIAIQQVVLKDFNGDNREDLLVINDSTVELYANDASGYSLGSPLIEVESISSVQPADIDGDGDLDLVTSSYTANLPFGEQNTKAIQWHENQQGTFETSHDLVTMSRGSRLFALADVESDGDVDIVSNSIGAGSDVILLRNDGVGGFTVTNLHNQSGRVEAFAFVDQDADGDLDLVLETTLSLSWHENLQGSFSERHELIPPTAFGVIGVEAVDVDGDQDLDILGYAAFQHRILWFENVEGEQRFPRWHEIAASTEGFSDIAHTDFDGDGDVDVLMTNQTVVGWYENDGSGRFSPLQVFDIQEPIVIMSFTDVDNDGDADLITDQNDSVVVYTQTEGQLSVPTVVASDTNVYELLVDDLDGDDNVDILVLEWNRTFDSEMRLVWLEDNGAEFDRKTLVEHLPFSIGLTIVDFDQDNLRDILINTEYDFNNQVSFFRNEGNSSFAAPRTLIDLSRRTDLFWVDDIDGDQDNDLLASQFGNTPKLHWFENTDSMGSMGDAIVIDHTGKAFSDAVIADFDGDSDNDILAGALIGDSLLLYETRNVGDVNNDGAFDSSDLVEIFMAGEYDDGFEKNSTFLEGDWNGDGEFDSADLVVAFRAGTYAAPAAKWSIAAAIQSLFAIDGDDERLNADSVDTVFHQLELETSNAFVA